MVQERLEQHWPHPRDQHPSRMSTTKATRLFTAKRGQENVARNHQVGVDGALGT